MKRLACFLVAALAWPASLPAQTSDFDDATASIEVVGTVDVIKVADLIFGQHPAAAGVINSSDVGTSAFWDVILQNAQRIDVTFSLPSVLTSGGGTVPVTFGTTSAELADGGGPVTFDPNVGLTGHVPTASSLSVKLGADTLGDGTGNVTVDIGGAAAGVYTGTITLTVTIL